MKKITINGNDLTLEQIELVSNKHYQVEIDLQSIEKVEKSRKVVEKIILDKKIVYGINTGFGYLKNTVISESEIEKLQENLIISHCVGLGNLLPENIVRAVMLLRANALAKGYSGVRMAVIQQLIDFLNNNIIPLVPEKGSLGASGDLAPLSHMALALIGKGEVFYKGEKLDTNIVLKKLDLKPLVLQAKEGLALINGTQVMTAIGALITHKAKKILNIADVISAMSLDSLQGSTQAFKAELHMVRAHKGQVKVAKNLVNLLKNSDILNSHQECNQVQDAYSLRCIPQVHGAIRDSVSHIEKVIVTEINSVTDNPIVLSETNEVISCGHFHGEPIALVMDFFSTSLAELANISERRIERLVNPQLSNGLPSFLINNIGVNSGFMIAQYTAASLVSENKSLAHPASVDSIPSSANQEDHVSMGTIAARKARDIMENVDSVLSIEAICAAQALDFRRPLKSSQKIETIHQEIRKKIPELLEDRNISIDINNMKKMLNSDSFQETVDKLITG